MFAFPQPTIYERVAELARKSNTNWLTTEETKELIKIRDSKEDADASELAGIIIKDQHDKLCGKTHW